VSLRGVQTASMFGLTMVDLIETPRLRCERLRPEHASELEALLLDSRVARTLWPQRQRPTAADLLINRLVADGACSVIERAALDKLIAVDSTNEAGVQRLMIVLDQLGRRGEAMRAFRTLVKVLQRDYNIMPLPETRQIYEELRRGNAQGTRSNEVTTSELRSVREGSGTRDAAGGEMSQAQPAQAVQIGRAHQSPLVGRESELEQLRELVQVAEYASRFKSVAQRRSSISSLACSAATSVGWAPSPAFCSIILVAKTSRRSS